MICATASVSYGLFYAFKEADETSAACFIQLIHTGIGQHLCEHMAHLVLQDQVHIVGVQLRVLCKDLPGPLGVLLQIIKVMEANLISRDTIDTILIQKKNL